MDADDGSDRSPSEASARPTIFVVEPLALFAECLHLALELGGFVVVGQARTLKEAMTQLASLSPAAIVCDLDFPAGLNACREIARRYPACPLVGLSGQDSPEALVRAQTAGAAALVSKHSGLPSLLASLRTTRLHRGLAPVDFEPASGTQPGAQGSGAPSTPLQTLSAREREVARHIGRGLTNKEVARLMRVAPVTVRNHLSNAMGKLGARSRAEVAAIVALAGWLKDGDL